jgi:hypothetical protein
LNKGLGLGHLKIALGLFVRMLVRIEIIIIVASLLSNEVVWYWHVELFLLWVLLVLHWSLVVEIVIVSGSIVVKIWSGLVSVLLLVHWLA